MFGKVIIPKTKVVNDQRKLMAFEIIRCFTNRLGEIEQTLKARIAARQRTKSFLTWFDLFIAHKGR